MKHTCRAASRLLLVCALAVSSAGLVHPAIAQQAAQSSAPAVMDHAEAARLMPSTVFFAGKTAPVQERNTAGLLLADHRMVLTALVDTSGYSSGVQSKYQAYLLTESPLLIEGKRLPIGAYGCGFVAGRFLVLNLAGDVLFSVPAVHDTAIRRPDPLQLTTAPGGGYRLYSGRDYATLRPDR